MPHSKLRVRRSSPGTRLRRTFACVLSALLLSVAAPLLSLGAAAPAAALGNGLAPTPQMGFNDWNAYGCNVSESLIKSTALAMHNNGMQAAGYQYVNIDDCWMTHSPRLRRPAGAGPRQVPRRDQGHRRLRPLARPEAGHLRGRGHRDLRRLPRQPRARDHRRASRSPPGAWTTSSTTTATTPGVRRAQTRYTTMRDALAATGRPILFSLCNWGQENVWTWGAGVGNSWRTTGDINASFSSMLSIFHSNVGLASYAGPGHWNDPDMLEVGNGMTATESRSEFSLWAEMAAPLIAGHQHRHGELAPRCRILTNTRVIAVDQDSLGKQGTEVSSSGGLDVLAKPLANGDVSVALFNETGSTATISHHRRRDRQDRRVQLHPDRPVVRRHLHHHGHDQRLGARARHRHVPRRRRHHRRRRHRRHRRAARGGRGQVPGRARTPRTTAGTQLEIWDCNGGANQTWTHTASNQLTVYSGSSQLCLDAYNNQTSAGHQGGDLAVQRPGQPAVAAELQRHHHRRPVRTVPGRDRQRRPPTARWSSCGPATAAATSNGRCELDPVGDLGCGGQVPRVRQDFDRGILCWSR